MPPGTRLTAAPYLTVRARVFDLKLIAADPYVNAVEVSYIGARKVDLPTLMRESDFVVTIPLLNDETRHLISTAQFALMKTTASGWRLDSAVVPFQPKRLGLAPIFQQTKLAEVIVEPPPKPL